MISTQLLEKLLTRVKGERGVVDSDLLQEYAKQATFIMSQRRRIEDEKEYFEEDCHNKRQEFLKMEQELKNECPHLATTWHPDASGNNDSWTTCDMCGCEI